MEAFHIARTVTFCNACVARVGRHSASIERPDNCDSNVHDHRTSPLRGWSGIFDMGCFSSSNNSNATVGTTQKTRSCVTKSSCLSITITHTDLRRAARRVLPKRTDSVRSCVKGRRPAWVRHGCAMPRLTRLEPTQSRCIATIACCASWSSRTALVRSSNGSIAERVLEIGLRESAQEPMELHEA